MKLNPHGSALTPPQFCVSISTSRIQLIWDCRRGEPRAALPCPAIALGARHVPAAVTPSFALPNALIALHTQGLLF